MDFLENVKMWKEFPNLAPELKAELESLDEKGLEEAFGANLEFGTGGMRGILGVGTNRMNYYTVRKATLGFGRYLLNGNFDPKKGVVISYDNRYYSKEFAFDSADLLSSLGFKVYVFESLRATPELSFAVRYLKAIAGIMITASHNPKNYNGYKIYDENGCQLIPELASQVIDQINQIENIFAYNINPRKELIEIIGHDVDVAYMKMVDTIRINKDLHPNFNITFTPLHGTGAVLGPTILKNNGFVVHPVESQMINDPAFPNVSSSNPENKEAFDRAIEQGMFLNSKLVMANDPDADRLGIAVLHNGKYQYLNGNEMAAVCFNYICEQYSEKGLFKPNSWLFTTNVSSPLTLEIAKKYGVNTYVGLTGFKYIGSQAAKIEGTGNYLYGFEESYGCLIKDFVRDKDAMQAILFFAEIEAYLEEVKGIDIIDYLDLIYKEYGYYYETQSNIYMEGLEGKAKIAKIMDYFRNNEPILKFDKIVRKEDNYLKLAYDYEVDRVVTSQIELDKSNVLKYFFQGGAWFVLRPSGTEPKLKIYFGTKGRNKDEALKLNKELKDEVTKLLNAVL